MNEEKSRDNFEEMLKEELRREAEAIRAEVNQNEALRNVTAPKELDQKIMEKIRKAEEERKAYENLSEEDKEALRLGREAQIQRDLEKLDVGEDECEDECECKDALVSFKGKKKKRKVFLLVAAVAILVLAMGMTSIGGRPFILDVFDAVVGNKEVTILESEQEGNMENDGEISDEELFYQSVEETFGTQIVKIAYTPENTVFLMGEIDESLNTISILYQCDDQIMEYQILVNYRSQAHGYDVEDELISEKVITVSDVSIDVKEYKLPDDTHQFVAQFEYKKNFYILNSATSDAEFEKILKNLNFF